MSRYISGSWNILSRKHHDLPDYDREVMITVHRPKGDKYQITTGVRFKTDAEGEHWDFKLKKGVKKDWEVVAWAEVEPWTPEG